MEASVEKSIFGIETGIFGIWAHNEFRLTNTLALRTELGYDAGIFGGAFYQKTGFIMAPVITLEPRFYYNLSKIQNQKTLPITVEILFLLIQVTIPIG